MAATTVSWYSIISPRVTALRRMLFWASPTSTADNTGDNPDGSNAFENPSAIAFDGTSLYVTDTFNRRVVVHTPGIPNIPAQRR